MTADVNERHVGSVPATREWPTFCLNYTFDPEGIERREEPAPDELVVFDASTAQIGSAWVTAERGSYVSIEDVR